MARVQKRFTDILSDIRNGDVIAELTEQLRDVVTRLERVKDRAALEALGAVLEAEREVQGDE
mgnify:CR=1 FL=1